VAVGSALLVWGAGSWDCRRSGLSGSRRLFSAVLGARGVRGLREVIVRRAARSAIVSASRWRWFFGRLSARALACGNALLDGELIERNVSERQKRCWNCTRSRTLLGRRVFECC
jgi:hypothetical protein